MQTNTKIQALNRKSQTPEFIVAELNAQVPDLESILVTVRFKDGAVGTICSHMSPETLCLLDRLGSIQVERILEMMEAGEGPPGDSGPVPA